VFVAVGDSRFLARTLTACGRRDRLGADLHRRLLAWGIMHRYNNLSWWMRRPPERRRAVAIYGPTSSGKTALSLEVCEAASERGALLAGISAAEGSITSLRPLRRLRPPGRPA
jgi:hypothetical protein